MSNTFTSSTLYHLDPKKSSFGSDGANLAMQGLGTALSWWSAFNCGQGFVPSVEGRISLGFVCGVSFPGALSEATGRR